MRDLLEKQLLALGEQPVRHRLMKLLSRDPTVFTQVVIQALVDHGIFHDETLEPFIEIQIGVEDPNRIFSAPAEKFSVTQLPLVTAMLVERGDFETVISESRSDLLE